MAERNTGLTGSLSRTFAILRNNSSLIILSFLWAVFAQLLNVYSRYSGEYNWTLQFLWLFIWVLLYPFFKGGFFKITIKAQDAKEENWFSIFKEGGRDKFVPLLLGLIAYLVIGMIFFIGVYVIFAFSTIIAALIYFLFEKLSHEFVGIALAIFAILLFLPLFCGLFVGFNIFVQFYDIGIVSRNYKILESFKQSYKFTRTRFNSVFGFTLVKYGAMFVLYLPIMLYVFKTTPLSLDQTTPATLQLREVLGFIIVGTISTAFSFTYHSTFYVQNIVEKEEYESRSRILLKLYGIGFAFLILTAGLIALTYLLVGPSIEELAQMYGEGLVKT